jgi:hypothetical protein
MQNAASINANKQEGRIDKKESSLSISKAVVTLPDSWKTPLVKGKSSPKRRRCQSDEPSVQMNASSNKADRRGPNDKNERYCSPKQKL